MSKRVSAPDAACSSPELSPIPQVGCGIPTQTQMRMIGLVGSSHDRSAPGTPRCRRGVVVPTGHSTSSPSHDPVGHFKVSAAAVFRSGGARWDSDFARSRFVCPSSIG